MTADLVFSKAVVCHPFHLFYLFLSLESDCALHPALVTNFSV